MRKSICYILLLLSMTVLSQVKKTCSTPKPDLEDMNAITKCKITSSKGNKSKKGQVISVKVSANKARFLKKRKDRVANGASVKGVGLVGMKSKLSKTGSISISNVLSLEKVKKAKKFIEVDEVPAFDACVATKGDDRVACFNREMVRHIEKYFNYPDEAIVKKIEGKVTVRFIIGSDGTVSNVKVHTTKQGKQLLKDEALRVVSYLSNFKPATKKGKPVTVKYSFPINFSLGE